MTTSTVATSSEPRIHGLLVDAHAALRDLEVTRSLLLQRGLAADDLPARHHLMAFAALGDHDRVSVLSTVQGEPWSQLLERGLANAADPMVVGTAQLRLLAHVLPHLAMVETLDTALAAEGPDLPEAPAGLLRVLGNTAGLYWGEPMRLQVCASRDVNALRIQADQAFGIEPLLLRAGSGDPLQEDLHLLADEGRIVFTVLDRTGSSYRSVVQIELARSPEEMW